jgi:hypothetical protein
VPSIVLGLAVASAALHAQPPVSMSADLSALAKLATEWTLDGTGSWTIRDGVLALEKPGVPAGPIRRPAALAVLRSKPLSDVTLELEVRSTAPLPDKTPRRDALLIAGYQSPSRFYYVHISAVRDAVHNGIFLVADADRRRIDTRSERAVLVDSVWHRARLVRDVTSGRLDVFVDGEPEPIMTAIDKTLTSGRVGVGSFDDTAEFRSIRVTATDPLSPLAARLR